METLQTIDSSLHPDINRRQIKADAYAIASSAGAAYSDFPDHLLHLDNVVQVLGDGDPKTAFSALRRAYGNGQAVDWHDALEKMKIKLAA